MKVRAKWQVSIKGQRFIGGQEYEVEPAFYEAWKDNFRVVTIEQEPDFREPTTKEVKKEITKEVKKVKKNK